MIALWKGFPKAKSFFSIFVLLLSHPLAFSKEKEIQKSHPTPYENISLFETRLSSLGPNVLPPTADMMNSGNFEDMTALYISKDKTRIYYSGFITTDLPYIFKHMPKTVKLIRFESFGSKTLGDQQVLKTSLEASKILREKSITTEVFIYCYGICTLLFQSGQERRAAAQAVFRYNHKSFLGFSPYGAEPQLLKQLIEAYVLYGMLPKISESLVSSADYFSFKPLNAYHVVTSFLPKDIDKHCNEFSNSSEESRVNSCHYLDYLNFIKEEQKRRWRINVSEYDDETGEIITKPGDFCTCPLYSDGQQKTPQQIVQCLNSCSP